MSLLLFFRIVFGLLHFLLIDFSFLNFFGIKVVPGDELKIIFVSWEILDKENVILKQQFIEIFWKVWLPTLAYFVQNLILAWVVVARRLTKARSGSQLFWVPGAFMIRWSLVQTCHRGIFILLFLLHYFIILLVFGIVNHNAGNRFIKSDISSLFLLRSWGKNVIVIGWLFNLRTLASQRRDGWRVISWWGACWLVAMDCFLGVLSMHLIVGLFLKMWQRFQFRLHNKYDLIW